LKFFTIPWLEGDLPDADADQVYAAYEAHLAALGPNLPAAARRLWTEISLHDGLVRRVKRGSDSLEVQLRVGNQQSGYMTATLRYSEALLSDADEQFLTSAAGRREIELLYNEFDGSEKIWLHRLLFIVEAYGKARRQSRRYYEVSVSFATLKVDVAPAAGRFDDNSAG
jgi:hypothetical protein